MELFTDSEICHIIKVIKGKFINITLRLFNYFSFTRLAQVEKARAKLQSDLEAQAQALDQAQILNNSMEKKAKQFDR